jgi:hypothetical protein
LFIETIESNSASWRGRGCLGNSLRDRPGGQAGLSGSFS